MTIKEKSDKLYKAFLAAWDNYKTVEKRYANSTGFDQLLSSPELKAAYQKWQSAVSEYYDFMRSVEKRNLSEQLAGS